MGRKAKESGGGVTPRCPKCGKEDPATLAGSERVDRYQCRDIDCLEQFSIPKTGGGLAESLEAARKEQEEIEMAKLTCEKGCGKTFVHPKRKENHEAKCEGEKKGARRPKASRATRRPAPPEISPAEFARAIPDESVALQLVKQLRQKRTAHEEKIAEIDRLIEAVTKASDIREGA